MATSGTSASIVMGPEGSVHVSSTFTEKLPPSFDGHTSYSVYRQDVELWLCLTSLEERKQGPALIGRLSGEAKASAKTISVAVITGNDGAEKILEHLDKSYAIDATDQLDIDLATFLDYSWQGNMPVEQFIAGFHSRLDRIASLNIDAKLKGHLLLRQAGLDLHTRNMIVGASSGKYDVTNISNALRQAYRNSSRPATLTSQTKEIAQIICKFCKKKGHVIKDCRKRLRKEKENSQVQSTEDTFYTFRTTAAHPVCRAIIDSGACTSVVGKDTLNESMKRLQLENVDDASPKLHNHRFGNYEEDQRSLFAVKFPFEYKCGENNTKKFKIHFDVIQGSLPFLIGFPSLTSMAASLNFGSMTLGLKLSGEYCKIPLEHDQHHLYLPFKQAGRSYYSALSQSAAKPDNHSSYPIRLKGKYSPGRTDNGATFDARDLKKLHLQLKHATHSAMRDWIRAAGRWSPDLDENIRELLLECKCQTAKNPLPHSVASTSIPVREKQTVVALDVVFLEGVPCLHVVDKCTGWSETATLRKRSIPDQIAAFAKIQMQRHGNPERIYGDREYLNQDFKSLCDEISAQFIPVAANDHEANGSVERANRTLRNFFRRIRAEDQKSSISEVLSEATYGKNICVGSKGASSFELMYGRKPRILGGAEQPPIPAITIDQHAESVARHRMDGMLRSNVRRNEPVKVGDYVYFWRDKSRWLGPARIVGISNHVVTLVHDESTKTSSLNRVRKAYPPLEDIVLDDDDEPVSGASGAPTETLTPADILAPAVREISDRTSDDMIMARSSSAQGSARRDGPLGAEHDEEDGPWRVGWKRTAYSPGNELPNTSNYTTFLTDSCSCESHEAARCTHLISPAEQQRAYAKEVKNWHDMGAMKVVARSSVPDDANIIGSHTDYRRKMDGSLKGRIVPWGHRDSEKYFLRTDAPSMNMEVFRLVVSISVEMGWEICEMDVTAAFLQAKGFNRDVFVRPPREEGAKGVLWKLSAAVYGLVDSGRLWYLTSDSALRKTFNLTKSKLENTLYFRHNEDGKLCFLVVCQVDNYIYAGEPGYIEDFEKFLHSEFDIGELCHRNFTVYGCEFEQHDDRSVTITQSQKLKELDDNVEKSPGASQRSGNELATNNEITAFKSVLGKMLFIGRMSQPVMLRISSHMATKARKLLLHHLKDLDALIRYSKQYKPCISFPSTRAGTTFHFDVYSDASMSLKDNGSSRGGFVIFRRSGDIVHPIYWSSRKLRRVARSSSTAEILAAADAVDMASYLAALTSELTYSHAIEFTTDSRSLFNLASTTKEPTERLNKADLSAIREAFESGTIRKISWCPGYYLVADALTKDNRESSAHLLKVLRDGRYPIHADSMHRMSPKEEV